MTRSTLRNGSALTAVLTIGFAMSGVADDRHTDASQSYETNLTPSEILVSEMQQSNDEPIEVTKVLPAPIWSAEGAFFGSEVAIDGDTVVVSVRDDDLGTKSGAAYVFERDEGGPNVWGQVAKLVADDGAPNDVFGSAVAISGDTVIVGSIFDDVSGGGIGSAYIFERHAGGSNAWGQVQKLTPVDGAASVYFGTSVCIEGDIAIVGADYDNTIGEDAGAAYVFERTGTGAWEQTARLLAPDGSPSDRFGWAVSISGHTAVVVALYDDVNGSRRGSAHVFERAADTPSHWEHKAILSVGGGTYDSRFGFSVSISGDFIVVGAPWATVAGNYSGSAYVFARSPDTGWRFVQELQPTDATYGTIFGQSVSIDGPIIVIGASLALDQLGAAYVFERTDSPTQRWEQIKQLSQTNGSRRAYFGDWVSVRAGTLVVGTPQDDFNGPDSGSVVVFDADNGGLNNWGETIEIHAPDALTARLDRFGTALDVDGTTLVVGAWESDPSGFQSGSAFVFEQDENAPGIWDLATALYHPEGERDDRFGYAVAISNDTVVVGAPYDSAVASGSGSVFVFTRSSLDRNLWNLSARLVASDGVAHDQFGSSVSIHEDTIVVGAPYDDDQGTFSGAVYIFSKASGAIDAWIQIAKLVDPDGDDYDHFGQSVSIHGDTVVVGSSSDRTDGIRSGSACAFERSGPTDTDWRWVTKLLAPYHSNDGTFGATVSVHGDVIAVGAPLFDDLAASNAGAAFLFSRNEGASNGWGLIAELRAPELTPDAHFGRSISVQGNTVLVGESKHDFIPWASGAAYTYERESDDGSEWTEIRKLVPSDPSSLDYFGSSVALGDQFAFIGVPQDDDVGYNSGSAVVFALSYSRPWVSGVTSTPPPPDGVLTEGDWSAVGITDLHVTFSEQMRTSDDPAEPGIVTDASNWLLVSAGSDGLIQTASCSHGLAHDDTALVLNGLAYNSQTQTLSLHANEGTPLTNGRYALFACGTLRSSIRVLLDGDQDGNAEENDDFSLRFSIDSTAPANPIVSATSHAVNAWSADTIVDLAWSGSWDEGIGVAGYSVVMDSEATTIPNLVLDFGHLADPHSTSVEVPFEGDAWFHLRACDGVGNCSAPTHLGPFRIDTGAPTEATDLISTSHAPDTPSTTSEIDVQWTAASDALSGVAGSAVAFSGVGSWTCDEIQDTTATSFTSQPLADGVWYAHVCAVDAAGNWGPVATAGPFVIDTTGPDVASIGSEGGTTDGLLSEAEDALVAITQLWVTFSEPVDPVGADRGIADPSHYRLVSTGADGLLSTLDCDAGPSGDDLEITIDSAWAWSDDATVSFQIDRETGLAAGSYALIVCDMRDVLGNAQSSPLIRRFGVAAENLLRNPAFDAGLDGTWEVIAPNAADIRHLAQDASSEASGMVIVDPVGNPGDRFQLSQCVEVDGGTPYVLGGLGLIDSSDTAHPTLKVMVRYFRNLGCTSHLETTEATLATGSTHWEWTPRLFMGSSAPAEALSARVTFAVVGGTSEPFTAYLDETALFENVFFVDGFESGDTGWWETQVP